MTSIINQKFKVIEDVTLTYMGNRQLYVMLVDNGGKYQIVVDSRNNRVGEKVISNARIASSVFKDIVKSLGEFVVFAVAFEFTKSAFCLETLNESLFLLKHSREIVDLNGIWCFKLKYHFMTYPEVYDFKLEDEKFNQCIKVYFGPNKHEIGCYRAIDSPDKLLFKFYTNPYYPPFKQLG